MPQYIIRVELHEAIFNDYEILHDAMLDEEFYKIIQDTNTEIFYRLPMAEYNYVGENEDINQIAIKVERAASQTQRRFSIVVTKCAGIIFAGLERLPD